MKGASSYMTKLFSYVVDHDYGEAPNPFGRYCTLAQCKYGTGGYKNVVELAEKGDWIVGTGGADLRKSAGHGKLIYAMRVDENPSLTAYCNDRRFAKRIDAKHDLSTRDRFALVSRYFYYFGRQAVRIPSRFLHYPLEQSGQGFRYRDFTEDFIRDFTTWLELKFEAGMNGWPCGWLPEFTTQLCILVQAKVRRRCGEKRRSLACRR
jgi:hypothetical protein